ncbi:UNVERIFIED_CONTAM: hypothetical protein GTU68_054279 [Idotea baltica]|jgi:hypothetical protein
MLPD